MAYIQPLVMVFQEYLKTSTSTPSATLPPCVVGPCFHIVDPDDEVLALAGRYSREGLSRCFFPNNRPGAVIQAGSVRFRLKNALALLTAAPVPVRETESNALKFQDGLFPTGLAIGDYAVFFDHTRPDAPVPLEGEYRVTGLNAGASTVLLNRRPPAVTPAMSAVTVEFRRKCEEVTVPGDAEGVFLDLASERFDLLGQSVVIDGTPRALVDAEVYVGYSALRQDLSQGGCLYSMDDIKGTLGKVSPENPLAFGLSIALANTTVGVWYVGVDSDDLAGYTAAKDRLENLDPIYAIVPLTTAPSVLAMFKMHAEQMSVPEVGMWRVALGSSELPTAKTLAQGRAAPGKDGDGDLVVLRDAAGTFLSHEVDAGDTLFLTAADGTEHAHMVAGVVAEDMLTVVQSAPFDADLFEEAKTYVYRVERSLDKTAQAREIAAASRAYGSSRFVHVWPDICVVGGRELPGYYLACAVAGAVGGLPSHYGLTRLSIAGVDGLRHAGDYFRRDQLDAIADGGTFIFMQAGSQAPPHIRHQLTTDRSTLEFQELSFVKNYDYVSYLCRDAMDVYLGKWNVTPETLATLETTLRGLLETLRLASQPKIGSPILGYDITSVAQLDDVRDRVEMYAEVDFPYPLNTIGLHILSR